VLAIFLIGQGSPFWFQVFQKLSSATQFIRGLGLGRKLGREPETVPSEEGADSPPASTPDDPVEAFLIAPEAKKLETHDTAYLTDRLLGPRALRLLENSEKTL